MSTEKKKPKLVVKQPKKDLRIYYSSAIASAKKAPAKKAAAKKAAAKKAA